MPINFPKIKNPFKSSSEPQTALKEPTKLKKFISSSRKFLSLEPSSARKQSNLAAHTYPAHAKTPPNNALFPKTKQNTGNVPPSGYVVNPLALAQPTYPYSQLSHTSQQTFYPQYSSDTRGVQQQLTQNYQQAPHFQQYTITDSYRGNYLLNSNTAQHSNHIDQNRRIEQFNKLESPLGIHEIDNLTNAIDAYTSILNGTNLPSQEEGVKIKVFEGKITYFMENHRVKWEDFFKNKENKENISIALENLEKLKSGIENGTIKYGVLTNGAIAACYQGIYELSARKHSQELNSSLHEHVINDAVSVDQFKKIIKPDKPDEGYHY